VWNVEGDKIRDWSISEPNATVFPYDDELTPIPDDPKDPTIRFLWPHRTHLWLRTELGGNHVTLGMTWHEWSRFIRRRFRTPLSIAFAFVATHNHFVLDRGGKVFKQSAPVIKLPPEATEDDHLALLGLLNSSVACFWMKQVFYPKGGDHVGTEGARVRKTLWEERFEHDGTKMQAFPIPVASLLRYGRRLDAAGTQQQQSAPETIVANGPVNERAIADAATRRFAGLTQMMSAQEELDWYSYGVYSILDDPPTWPDLDSIPPIQLGERAFEIVMARKIAEGELQTTWFERHGSTPITEIPDHWPDDYRQIVQRRIDLIESDRSIRLIEQPEYKRRWNTESWESQLERALKSWLLDRLEDPRYWPRDGEPRLQSCARLADLAAADTDFMQVATLYRGHETFDVTKLVTELVQGEAVPHLPALRYKTSGLRKREAWEETWALQRREDAGEDIPFGDIPVPPKYKSSDFTKSTYWKLRGKLDVPKERFVSYPHAEREADPTPVVGWAGWDHLQQAKALSAYYTDMKGQEGWTDDRLVPLLLGIAELVPWLLQWHNDFDPEFDTSMGDFFKGFVDTEARGLGMTVDDLKKWEPPKKTRGRKRKPREATS